MLRLKRLSVFNKYKGVVLNIRTFLKPTSSPLMRIQTCGFLNTAYFSLLLLSISLFCESHGQLETTSTTDSWSSRRRSKNQNTNKIKVEVKVWENGQQNVQLVFQHCFKTSWIAISSRVFYHPRIKLVTQQISLLQVAKSCCRGEEEVLIFATKPVHVARFTGPRQTCFAASDVNYEYDITPAKF